MATPTVEEGNHKFADGKEVPTKTYKAEGTEVAQVLFLHGFSDHMDRYKDLLFPQLAAAGITVHSFDQRGWGRAVAAPAERGLTGPTTQVLSDVESVLASHLPAPVPFFLMGHSMGGLNTAYFLSKGKAELRTQLAGFVLSSPFIGFAPENAPPRIKVVAGRILGNFMPKRQLANKMDPSWMSHDDAFNAGWRDDPLCHDTGTLEGLAELLDRQDGVNAGTHAVPAWDGLKVLVIHGDADKTVACTASQAWLDRLPTENKEIKIYKGGYHCLFAEPDGVGDQFRKDVIEFITTTAKEKSSAADAQSKL